MKNKSLLTITAFLLLTSINVNADSVGPPQIAAPQGLPQATASKEPANLDPSLGPGHISFLQGYVQIKGQGGDKWLPAAVNTPILKGDSLWVPNGGRLELQLPDGAYVRLDSNTSVDISDIEGKDSRISLHAGKIYVYSKPYEAYSLEISTPTIVVRSNYSSVFMMNAGETGVTDVKVTRGKVFTEDKTGRHTLTAVKSARGSLSEWEVWNLERDATLALSAYGESYVADKLRACAPSLSRYGRWVHTTHYGEVWTPTVSVGWTPYRDGRWAWIGGDYVWISYEPWGWMPYHYGRWAYDVAFGWGWIPPLAVSVAWGPGFVGWVNTPAFVGWFPLGPSDVYYGYGYFGPGSVNIASVGVNFGTVAYGYRNFYARAGFTTVAMASFNSGNYRPSAPNPTQLQALMGRNALTTQNVSFGRPNITSARAIAARMPSIRNIPNSALPPSRLASVSTVTRSAMSSGRSLWGINPGSRGINTGQTSTIGPHGQASSFASQARPFATQTRQANIAGNSMQQRMSQRASQSQASTGFNTPRASQRFHQNTHAAPQSRASTGFYTPGATQRFHQNTRAASQSQASTGFYTPRATQRYHQGGFQHQSSMSFAAPQYRSFAAPQGHAMNSAPHGCNGRRC
ncbi:MAG: FecR domain-containing protein [Nitrospirae bacterium]|nr:FecR domain-containing protein [Nitrospirota bacterium]